MTRNETAAQAREEHIRVLGHELGVTYDALHHDYFWLRLKWQEFIALFGSRERVAILNAAAPAYFQLTQDALSDDILIHLTRLMDRPKISGRANLTFLALPALMPSDSEVARLVANAQVAVSFARDWRNRRLAHRDLDVSLGVASKPLEHATRDRIDEALDSMHAILHHVATTYFGAGLDREVVEAQGGAETLLMVLRDGLALERQRNERFGGGDYEPEDFEPLPPL